MSSDQGDLTVRLDSNRGYSAYEIACQHGYTGTEEQWIAATQGLPEYYLKTAVVSGDTLTLTKQDNTTVAYTPSSVEVDWDDIENKPSAFTPATHTHTASECGALPSSTTIPTKTSQLTNDSGFVTASTQVLYTIASRTQAGSLSAGESKTLTISAPTLSGWELVRTISAYINNCYLKMGWGTSGGNVTAYLYNPESTTQSYTITVLALMSYN